MNLVITNLRRINRVARYLCSHSRNLRIALLAAVAIVGLISHFSFLISPPVASAATVSTTVVTTPAVLVVSQTAYRWYANEDALTPGTTLAAQSTATTTPATGTALRLRIAAQANFFSLPSGATFRLQFSAATSSGWADLGTSTAWTFLDNAGVADGQIIVTTVLTGSDVGESYNESNPSVAMPNTILAGQEGEWDWAIQNASAATSSSWFFRFVYASGTTLDAYDAYPTLSAAVAPPPPPPPAPPPAPPPSSGGGSVSGGGGSPGTGGGTASGTGFGVLVPPPDRPPSPCDSPIIQRVDFSGDCRVDIVDLSILVFYYGRGGPEIARYDVNSSGEVGLGDVSVLMFYWTQ